MSAVQDRPKAVSDVPCPTCAGTGKTAPIAVLWGKQEDPCPQCAGRGTVKTCPHCKGVGSSPVDEPEEKQRVMPRQADCEHCEGTGIFEPIDLAALGVPKDLPWLARQDRVGRFYLADKTELDVSEQLYLRARMVRMGLATWEDSDADAQGWREHVEAEATNAGVDVPTYPPWIRELKSVYLVGPEDS